MNDIEKRIEELTNELNYHNHKYYVDDAPEISDFAFDKMLVELEQLEEKYPEYKKKNSPTVRVGGEAVKSFGEVHHDVPMLSQQKAFSKEEILDFDRRVRAVVHDVNYVVEQKIDGLRKVHIIKSTDEVHGIAADAFVLMKPQVSSDRNLFRAVTPHIFLAGAF